MLEKEPEQSQAEIPQESKRDHYQSLLLLVSLGSAPGCWKLVNDKTGNPKKVFSVAFKFEKFMHMFLWCGLGLSGLMQRSKPREAFRTTHEILARMPLNSFSWSICWAFGAKCSWQNFVMVCLSWKKRGGKTHPLHLSNILSSSSPGSCQHSLTRQLQHPKPRSIRP